MSFDSDSGFHGGLLIAETLERRRVRFVFTLCGGHISPVLSWSAAGSAGWAS